MVRIVDVPLDAGNANTAIADLEKAITESRTAPDPKPQDTVSHRPQTDARFSGKTPEELVEMYTNLESHSGRLASQLGESRNALNQLILGKRENDLRQNGGGDTTRQPTEIKPTDLLANPTEAFERYLASRGNPEATALQRRLDQLEAKLGETVFTTRNPTAEAVTADPAFAAWVKQTPLRMTLAGNAAKGDYQAADMLLQEYRTAQETKSNTVTNAQTRAQELARTGALESGTASNEGGTATAGRIIKRADLIALRTNNPEKYESQAYQNEIIKAYVEGRVRD